jgi:ubiquinone/menaquinone biosynthesis C-methylase UbiE
MNGNTKEIFGQMALRYDTEDRIKIAAVISAKIRAELKETKAKTAVDYGCGTGLVGLALTDLFKSILFVDTAPQMIAQTREKIRKAPIDNAKTLCADFVQEPPHNLKTDILFMTQVLLHVIEPDLLLKNICHILNPGGRLLIVDFDKNERIVSDKVRNGFDQQSLTARLKELGFASAESATFYYGKKIFMNTDASLFFLQALKE